VWRTSRIGGIRPSHRTPYADNVPGAMQSEPFCNLAPSPARQANRASLRQASSSNLAHETTVMRITLHGLTS
jgi:hypothetical protein